MEFLAKIWAFILNMLQEYRTYIFIIVSPSFHLVGQTVKHLPAMWETWVRSLDWEDPLEKEMATHSSTLA